MKCGLKCVKNRSVTQRPDEGVFKLILEKEEGRKAYLEGCETLSCSVSRGVPPAALQRWKCAAVHVGGALPHLPRASVLMGLTAVHCLWQSNYM